MKKIKLGDACEILNGFAFKSENYVGSGIRVIRISNVQKGYIEDNTPAFYPLETKGLEKYMLEEGDLLISLTGNVGRVAILEKEFMPAALNQRVACLRLKTDKLSKRYLFHILNSDFFEKQCIQYSKGVAQKNMSTAWLKDYEILLYSKEQQELIADILDKMRLIKKSRYYELQKLDELVKARFVEMFGDPVTNDMLWNTDVLKDICTKIGSGSTPRGGKESYIDEGISLIRSMNVHNAYFEYKDLAHITLDQAEKLNNVVVEHDDLLFNITGASVARCCVVPSDVLPARVNQHVCILRCREKINPIFLQELLVNENYQGKLLQIAKSGATREAINKQQLESLEIVLPPLELQNQFASFVQEIDKSRLLSNHSLFLIKSITF